METKKTTQYEKLLFLNGLTYEEISRLHEKATKLKIGGCNLVCKLFNAYHLNQK